MTTELALSILAGFLVIVGLLFLSMIHLFMIPKDIMERDTTKRPPRRDDLSAADPREPQPEIEEHPKPEPEVERQPGQQREPEPDAEPKPQGDPPPANR